MNITDTTRFDERKRLYSAQRLSLPRDQLQPELALDMTLAYRLAALYFATVERALRPLLKVEIDAGEIQLIVRGRGIALRFGVGIPEVSAARTAIRWPIIGGWALDGSADDGGAYTVGAEWDEPRQNLTLFTCVEGYPSSIAGANAPPLRRLLYALTQGSSHKFYTRRFLSEAARELARDEGPKTKDAR
ncbi:MAG TPA: hypothetical protein VJG32_16175 [Anaerolineae bacterium]|nr:hypothetical protein [Anaerolineae bacterium]